MARKKVISYPRKAGKKAKGRHVYYVGIWNEVTQKYDRRATECTSKAAADEQGWAWYRDGLPEDSAIMLFEYLEDFWRTDSEYVLSVQDDRDNGQSMSPEYIDIEARSVKNHVERILNNCKIEIVTPAMLNAIKKDMREEYGAGAINSALKAIMVPLGHYWKQAGKPERNPARLVTLRPVIKVPRDILTLVEAKQFFEYPALPRKHRLVNQIAAFAGLRVSEIGALKIDTLVRRHDKDFDYYALKIEKQTSGRDPKGGRGEVVIPYALGRELQEFYTTESLRRGYFFDGRTTGTCMKKRAIELVFNSTIESSLNIDEEARKARKLTFHSWRHWYVTYVKAEAGKDVAMRMARHKSLDMTDLYTDDTTDTHSEGARVITSIYDKLAGKTASESIHADTRETKKR